MLLRLSIHSLQKWQLPIMWLRPVRELSRYQSAGQMSRSGRLQPAYKSPQNLAHIRLRFGGSSSCRFSDSPALYHGSARFAASTRTITTKTHNPGNENRYGYSSSGDLGNNTFLPIEIDNNSSLLCSIYSSITV